MKLIRRKQSDGKGGVRVSDLIYVSLKDHLQRRWTIPAYKDEEASENLGRTLDYLVLCRAREMLPTRRCSSGFRVCPQSTSAP